VSKQGFKLNTTALIPAWDTPLPAPAKINLFLHVVGRRPDGYHLLQTAFRMLARWDSLSFSPRDDGEIRLARPLPGVPEESDLCVRAARLLRAESGRSLGVTISLEKRLPMGGGLGGGSSDAATVLLALNRLWDIGLPRASLMKLGLSLGADVPFFLFGRNAFAEGVGEELQPLSLPEAWYLVVEPPVSVPTAEIFSAPDLTRNTESIKIAAFPAEGGSSFGRNDLEPVACRRYPAVAEALGWLGQFGAARMSGSGACVFAEYGGEAEALTVLARLPEGWKAWAARSLDEHPLIGCAG
jgi:4-diphosphocytidyl-2-C-methyl-D-erythritol kinase